MTLTDLSCDSKFARQERYPFRLHTKKKKKNIKRETLVIAFFFTRSTKAQKGYFQNILNNYYILTSCTVIKKLLVRCYCGLLGEEAAQVKNINATTPTATSTVIVIDVHICAAIGGSQSDANGTLLVASAIQMVSVTNARGDVQIQNSSFWTSAASLGGHLIPATLGGFFSRPLYNGF